jgi:hypothetical protein
MMLVITPPRVSRSCSGCCPGEPADEGLDGGDGSRPADQDNLVDIVRRWLRFAHRLLDRPRAALDQLGGEIVDVGRMIVMVRCLGPLASAVMNGRFTCYSLRLLSWRSSTARSATSTSATMSKWFG